MQVYLRGIRWKIIDMTIFAAYTFVHSSYKSLWKSMRVAGVNLTTAKEHFLASREDNDGIESTATALV